MRHTASIFQIKTVNSMKQQNIEYTNLISEDQAVERFIPFIDKNDIIGNPFDYNRNIRTKLSVMALDAYNRMYTFEEKKCLFFSFCICGLKSCKFPGIKAAMYSHKLASVIYDTVKKFDGVATLECARFYYTREPKEKTGTVSDLFPSSKESEEPSARYARGDYGRMPAYEWEPMIHDMDILEGWKFDKESDWTYTLHMDFKVFFDFSNMTLVSMYLKDKKWNGAFLTLLTWGVKNQEKHRAAYDNSDSWLIEYAPYQCANKINWYDLDLISDKPVIVRMPKTFEWWKGALSWQLKNKGYKFENGELIVLSDDKQEEQTISNETLSDTENVQHKEDVFEINESTKRAKYVINWFQKKKKNNLQHTISAVSDMDDIHNSSVHPDNGNSHVSDLPP